MTTDVIITAPDESVLITAGGPQPITLTSDKSSVLVKAGGLPGPPGATGPQGPQGVSGTMVVAVPYSDWPPVDPQPNTLYLRLAP